MNSGGSCQFFSVLGTPPLEVSAAVCCSRRGSGPAGTRPGGGGKWRPLSLGPSGPGSGSPPPAEDPARARRGAALETPESGPHRGPLPRPPFRGGTAPLPVDSPEHAGRPSSLVGPGRQGTSPPRGPSESLGRPVPRPSIPPEYAAAGQGLSQHGRGRRASGRREGARPRPARLPQTGGDQPAPAPWGYEDDISEQQPPLIYRFGTCARPNSCLVSLVRSEFQGSGARGARSREKCLAGPQRDLEPFSDGVSGGAP